MPLAAFLKSHASPLRQAARVLIGSLLAYAAYRFLRLPQGYWAVFTVIIVLQGSIASTLGAASDRLIGTIAGALIGGLAIFGIQEGDVTVGVALALVIGVTAFAAARRPQLKVAPVTAAILLLTRPEGADIGRFVIDRILEIALGGLIGVATSILVFPARSRPLVIARAADTIEQMRRILQTLATALESGKAPAFGNEHATLRAALNGVEQAASDAERERSSGLAYGAATPVISRALWRVRNDLVLVGRAVDVPLPPGTGETIALPAANLLRAEAAYAGRCAAALRGGGIAEHGAEEEEYRNFEATFASLRQTALIGSLDFAAAGRVFGLAFAIEVLHRDLADLGDRLGKDEGTPPKQATISGAQPEA
ncbi:MAG: FUSC family protein [Sphingomonas sp.]|nr:FUSC family protein [Sphingomonas sp.]PZU10967.1 MAG: FUSC family protein [Sphingomonas sp.]